MSGIPVRVFPSGKPDPLSPEQVALRFWSKVQKTSACWLWLGATYRDDYGIFRVGSQSNGTRRIVRAHRFAWELENGPIPDGLQVLHRCDNPACVRPDHLSLGTHRENMADMVQKNRAWRMGEDVTP